jgi:hypothetical protein
MASLAQMPSAEKGIGFELAEIASTGIKVSTEQQQVAFRWLIKNANPQCSPLEKFLITQSAWIGGERVDPLVLGFDPFDLVLAILPLTEEQPAVWQHIENSLHGLMHSSPERFRMNLRSLAGQHWKSLKKVMSEEKGLTWVFGELARIPWGHSFITSLYYANDEGQRRLGQFLFDSLQLAAPVDAGPPFTEATFQRWIAEFQLRTPYQSVSTQLLMAAQRLDQGDASSISAFQQEAYFQCINLPGLCLERLRPHVDRFPTLKTVVDSADTYFKTLASLESSAVKAQEIPGIRRYMFRKIRLERRRLEEEVERRSIFAQLVSKSYLLYGNQHAYFSDGELSTPSGLQGISTSVEVPRMETIAPEQCQMRRLGALVQLKKLKAQSGTSEEVE